MGAGSIRAQTHSPLEEDSRGPFRKPPVDGVLVEVAGGGSFLRIVAVWLSTEAWTWSEGEWFPIPASEDDPFRYAETFLGITESAGNRVKAEGPFSLEGGDLWLIADPETVGSREAIRPLLNALGRAVVERTRRTELEQRHAQALLELRALTEISNAGNSGLELEQVLQRIIETVGGFVDAESGGCLLYDEETNHLVLQKPAFGFHDEELIGRYRVPADGNSNAAIVFRSGLPYTSNHAERDPRLVQQFVRLYQARSTISVPLRIGNRRIGVFHVINKRREDFTASDQYLTELIAPHLAVLIKNSQLYEQLRQKHEALSRSRNISERLTQMVLRGASLTDILESLAKLVKGACLLLAPTGLVEGRGEPHGADLIPWEAFEDASRAALTGSTPETRSVWKGSLDIQGRAVPVISVPVAAGQDTGVHIVVAFWEHAPGPLDQQAIEQAATVLAVELLVQNKEWDIERRLRGDLVEELLTDRRLSEEEASRRAAYAGLDLTKPLRVAVIKWEGQDSASPSRRPSPRARSWMWQLVSRRWPRTLMGQMGGMSILVLPAAGDGSASDTVDTVIERVMDESLAAYPTYDCRSGIGRPGHGLEQLRYSYQDALDCLEVLHVFSSKKGCLRYEDLGVAGFLLRRARHDDITSFLQGTLGKLADHVDYHRELLDTLWEFYEAGSDRQEAARRLNVHPNTVTYRLRKVSELTGLDAVHRPSDITRLSLACLLYRLGASTGSDSRSDRTR